MAVALDRPYCTVAQVQAYLNNNDASRVDAICDGINDASRAIDDYTQWIFYKKAYTAQALMPKNSGPGSFSIMHHVPGKQASYIKAPYLPILKVSSIVQNNPAEANTLVEGTDYYVDYQNGQIFSVNSAWSMIPGFYTITADLGCDNGTNSYAAGVASPYNSAVPADTIPGTIHRYAIQIASIYANLMKKMVDTKGDGQLQVRNITEVPKSIIDELYLWRGRK